MWCRRVFIMCEFKWFLSIACLDIAIEEFCDSVLANDEVTVPTYVPAVSNQSNS